MMGIRKAAISPVGCYTEAKDLLGDQYANFLAISLVGLLIGGAVPLVLIGPMYCGMGLCLFARASGRPMPFDLLFKGFDYFVPSLVAMLIYVGVMLVLVIPFLILFVVGILLLNSRNDVLEISGGLTIGVAYIYWIGVCVVSAIFPFFACLLIVDRKLEAWPACQLAFRGIKENALGMVGTMLVGYLMVLVAMMLCLVPVIFVTPILVAGHFVAYQKIFGITAKPEPVMAQVVS